jgi:hypothetical protein
MLLKAPFLAAKGDPLGECEITPYGYSHMTHKLLELAGGKIVLALEGGYNLESISKSYAACTSVLLGDPPMAAPPEDTPLRLSSCTLDILNQVRKGIRTEGDSDKRLHIFTDASSKAFHSKTETSASNLLIALGRFASWMIEVAFQGKVRNRYNVHHCIKS